MRMSLWVMTLVITMILIDAWRHEAAAMRPGLDSRASSPAGAQRP
jgi:hypothetical protein